jgi:hypothetical protein
VRAGDQAAGLHREIERPPQRREFPIDLRRLRRPLRDLAVVVFLLALTVGDEASNLRRADGCHLAAFAKERQQVHRDLALVAEGPFDSPASHHRRTAGSLMASHQAECPVGNSRGSLTIAA